MSQYSQLDNAHLAVIYWKKAREAYWRASLLRKIDPDSYEALDLEEQSIKFAHKARLWGNNSE